MKTKLLWAVIGIAGGIALLRTLLVSPTSVWLIAPLCVLLFLATIGVLIGDPRDINKPQ